MVRCSPSARESFRSRTHHDGRNRNGTRKYGEIARTCGDFAKDNLGSHYSSWFTLIWVAEFDARHAQFIRANSCHSLTAARTSPRACPAGSVTTQRVRARSRLSADGSDNARVVPGPHHGGIPRISLSALV